MEHFRDSTRQNYYGIWRSFNEFFIKLDIKPNNWEDRLVLFVGHLIHKEQKSATIRSYVSAIRAVLSDINITLNEDKFLLASITRACKRRNYWMDHRFPIHRGILKLILKATESMFINSNQSYLLVLYKALFVTAYFGLFRIGELTQSAHVVLAKDVHIGTNKKKLLFVLRSSKTHGEDSRPQTVRICAVGNDWGGQVQF